MVPSLSIFHFNRIETFTKRGSKCPTVRLWAPQTVHDIHAYMLLQAKVQANLAMQQRLDEASLQEVDSAGEHTLRLVRGPLFDKHVKMTWTSRTSADETFTSKRDRRRNDTEPAKFNADAEREKNRRDLAEQDLRKYAIARSIVRPQRVDDAEGSAGIDGEGHGGGDIEGWRVDLVAEQVNWHKMYPAEKSSRTEGSGVRVRFMADSAGQHKTPAACREAALEFFERVWIDPRPAQEEAARRAAAAVWRSRAATQGVGVATGTRAARAARRSGDGPPPTKRNKPNSSDGGGGGGGGSSSSSM